MMRLIAIALFFLATSAFAAEELETTISVELARALFDLPQTGELRFYSQLPEGFPEFTVPPEFQLLGSMSLPNLSRVALRTEKELNEGMSVLADFLQSIGYRLVPVHPPRENGFVSAQTLPTPINVCHDEWGSIQVRALRRGSAHYFSLTGSSTPDSSGTTCAERVAERQRFIDSQIASESSGIRAYLPRLAIPQEEDADYRGFQPPSRSFGSDSGYELSSVIKSELSAREIYQHLAEQLQSQQWTQGQELTGSSFLQGEWQFINEDDHLISGTLQVEEQDEDNVFLRFTLSSTRDFYIPQPRVPVQQR